MNKEKIEYIIKNCLHNIPLEILKKLKYPYLTKEELEFEKENVAKIILEEYPEKVFFNYCPKCKSLTRTPQAKQCKQCFHNWH